MTKVKINGLRTMAKKTEELIALLEQVIIQLFESDLVDISREFAGVLTKLKETNEKLLTMLSKMRNAGL